MSAPGMQKFIAAPLNPTWHDLWKTGEDWRKAADKMDAGIVPTIPAMAERLHVKIEPSTIDGVKVFIVTPDEIPPQNRPEEHGDLRHLGRRSAYGTNGNRLEAYTTLRRRVAAVGPR
jgi:hypothetical protein